MLQGSTTVSANTTVDEGSTILYELYKKATVLVPYVIGVAFSEAERTLRNAHLKIKQGKPINTFDQPKGVVVRQSPRTTTPVSPGSTVTVRLSTGKVKLPDVAGKKSDDAKTRLNALGFTPVDNTSSKRKTADPTKDGAGRGDGPEPGIPYTADTKITLTIYHYVKPPPTCDPNKTPTPTPTTHRRPPSGTPSGSLLPSITPSITPTPTDTNTLPPCTQ